MTAILWWVGLPIRFALALILFLFVYLMAIVGALIGTPTDWRWSYEDQQVVDWVFKRRKS